jgi:hypothetical protein
MAGSGLKKSIFRNSGPPLCTLPDFDAAYEAIKKQDLKSLRSPKERYAVIHRIQADLFAGISDWRVFAATSLLGLLAHKYATYKEWVGTPAYEAEMLAVLTEVVEVLEGKGCDFPDRRPEEAIRELNVVLFRYITFVNSSGRIRDTKDGPLCDVALPLKKLTRELDTSFEFYLKEAGLNSHDFFIGQALSRLSVCYLQSEFLGWCGNFVQYMLNWIHAKMQEEVAV